MNLLKKQNKKCKSAPTHSLLKNLISIIALATVCDCLAACNQQNPDLQSSKSTVPANTTNQVRLSKQALDSAQLEILTAKSRPNQLKIITTGEIKADDNRVFHINSIVAGRVLKDNVVLGKVIKRNDELAVIQNLEVTRTYGDYVHQVHQNDVDIAQVQARLDLARKTVQRLTRLSQEGIVAEKDLLIAENQQKILDIDLKGLKEHERHIKAETKELLSAYGISLEEEEKKGLEHINSGSPLLAPKSGVVIKKNVTVGDVVNPSEILYVVADLSQVWLDIAVYDKDIEKIKEGQTIHFRSDSIPGTLFTGTISYIQPAVGDTAKTFLARAVLPNPQLILKPGMFGQAEIMAHVNSPLPYLPDRALQKYRNENFVFVKLANGSFEKRVVVLGNRIDDGYLIVNGIAPGEPVVGTGSFKLKSEFMKSEIGQED